MENQIHESIDRLEDNISGLKQDIGKILGIMEDITDIIEDSHNNQNVGLRQSLIDNLKEKIHILLMKY